MSVRIFIASALVLVAALALFLALVATDTALSVWQQLSEAPLWAQALYGLLLAGFATAAVLMAWRWLKPRSRHSEDIPSQGPHSPESLQEALVSSASDGVNVESALAELREQHRRKNQAEIHICVFGEVSSGKSSMVNALLPQVSADTDPRAGTTDEIRRYRWNAPSGDSVFIADLPGFNLDQRADILEEARRAHLVIFVCDDDLSASEHEQLKLLETLGKPLIIALNKSDQRSDREQQLIIASIADKAALSHDNIVGISSGGREELVKMLVDGSETRETRERKARVGALRTAVQREIDNNLELMENLQDTAVLSLAAEKLEQARVSHRDDQATQLVSTYSRRAIVGALAAVAPGSDLVIQGALATRLMQELCALYGVSVKEVQIESFLKMAGGKLRNMSAITLAIAGNALKAFPGLGTLSGGLLHAVAYGMIFDSLGRAAAQTLSSRGELRPYPAARAFEELMRENLETGAKRFTKLAISQSKTDHTA